jgi:hypothetical protein
MGHRVRDGRLGCPLLERMSLGDRATVCDSGTEIVSPALTGARPHPSPSPSVATDCVASSRQHHRLRLVPISLPRLSIGSGTKGLHRAPARGPTCPSVRASAGCTTAAPPRAPPWSRHSTATTHTRAMSKRRRRRDQCRHVGGLAVSAHSRYYFRPRSAPWPCPQSAHPSVQLAARLQLSKRAASGSPADALGRGHGGSRRSANRQAQPRFCGERCMVQF